MTTRNQFCTWYDYLHAINDNSIAGRRAIGAGVATLLRSTQPAASERGQHTCAARSSKIVALRQTLSTFFAAKLDNLHRNTWFSYVFLRLTTVFDARFILPRARWAIAGQAISVSVWRGVTFTLTEHCLLCRDHGLRGPQIDAQHGIIRSNLSTRNSQHGEAYHVEQFGIPLGAKVKFGLEVIFNAIASEAIIQLSDEGGGRNPELFAEGCENG